MATLNQIIAERRKFVSELNRLWRGVDTAGELIQRKLRSMRVRKRKVPEEDDLTMLAGRLRDTVSAENEFRKVLDRGYPL